MCWRGGGGACALIHIFKRSHAAVRDVGLSGECMFRVLILMFSLVLDCEVLSASLVALGAVYKCCVSLLLLLRLSRRLTGLRTIIGRSCHEYHFCRDKTCFCRDKSMFAATKLFVATKLCSPRQNFSSRQNYVLSRQKFYRNKHAFVATKMILVAPPVNDAKAHNCKYITTTAIIATVL